MVSLGGSFFTKDAIVPDEVLLKKQIYEELKAFVTAGLSKKVSGLLEVLRMLCGIPAYPGGSHSCGERNAVFGRQLFRRKVVLPKPSPRALQSQCRETGAMESHPFVAVLLDMGLGKTSITLTAVADLLFDSFEVHKVLVIAPLRVARDTWSAELQKWDQLHHLTYSVAVGSEAERKAALTKKADIYIINRENVQWLIEKSKLPFDYDMIVVDELSSFKNHQSKRFKALMQVRPRIKRVVGLTGTPASNGLMDLWAEFKVIDMGKRLGRFITYYRQEYFVPDAMNGQIVYSYRPKPGAEQAIYRKISDITISMKSTDHLKMPELISSEYKVYLSPNEQDAYDEMKKQFILDLPDGEISAANAAALSGKLSQMANGAIYDDAGNTVPIHEQKLDALEDIIESANGKPLLVAYWYQHDLERIMKRLHDRHIPFSKLDKADSIRRWNNGEIPVALIHPASAGHGLNLQTGGNTIVWFGLTWSLELYSQTMALRLRSRSKRSRSETSPSYWTQKAS